MKKIVLFAAMTLAMTSVASAIEVKCLDNPLNTCANGAGSTFSYVKAGYTITKTDENGNVTTHHVDGGTRSPFSGNKNQGVSTAQGKTK